MATHSSILAWRIPWSRGAWQATVQRVEHNLSVLACTHACRPLVVYHHTAWLFSGFSSGEQLLTSYLSRDWSVNHGSPSYHMTWAAHHELCVIPLRHKAEYARKHFIIRWKWYLHDQVQQLQVPSSHRQWLRNKRKKRRTRRVLQKLQDIFERHQRRPK